MSTGTLSDCTLVQAALHSPPCCVNTLSTSNTGDVGELALDYLEPHGRNTSRQFSFSCIKFLLTPKFVNNPRKCHTTSKKATNRPAGPAYLIHKWHAAILHCDAKTILYCESTATMSATQLLAQLYHHTFGLRSDAIERWTIEDWVLLTVLAIEGVLLGWLMTRLARRVYSGA
jgi:hypothetical protein